ncbi:MAG: hypothetical protein RIF41_07550 [Polyangiaceae bacterium]
MPDDPLAMKPGWINCGCHFGIVAGDDGLPRDCDRCMGGGLVYRYASGRLALYPGGPFCGSEHPDFASSVVREESSDA